ncbi:glycosyltransferase [Rhizobium leguminosarum]
MSAVIHHGGAGTTAAALRAGKPMTICPFFGDQPFWARRITDLGVGLSLARRALTVESLTDALAAMDDPLMRRQADQIDDLARHIGDDDNPIRCCGHRPAKWREIVA